MYSIKTHPEDFVVNEKIARDLIDAISQTPTKHLLFMLKKRNYSTLHALELVGQYFGVSSSAFGFAGLKDSRACTSQHVTISVPDIKPEKFAAFSHEHIQIEFIGYLPCPLHLGRLEANSFSLIVRNAQAYTIHPVNRMINYFGEQRFSLANAQIGLHLVKKEYAKALELIRTYTQEKRLNLKVETYLNARPTDVIGALGTIPLTVLQLYMHAVQSLWWNTVASSLVKDARYVDEILGVGIPTVCSENVRVPIIGFGYEPQKTTAQIAQAYDKIFSEQRISSRDFIMRAMPRLSQEGDLRDLVVPIKDLVVKDEGEIKHISFSLPAGSYATVALRHMLILQQDL
jgi:tRNA pseudouridine13 synthase